MSSIAVVVPVYGNAETVAELHARLRQSLGPRLSQVVYVDDASPDESLAALHRLRDRFSDVALVERSVNGGQHRALLDGLAEARADWIVTIDADLQDPPEAIGRLVASADGDTGAVFAARRGRYESVGRRISSIAFKRLFGAVAGVPGDASSFVAMRREVVERVLALDGRLPPFLTGMIAATGASTRSVAVERSRSMAPSGYSSRARVAAGAQALAWAVAARRRAHRSAAEHNEIQLDYYRRRTSRSIQPHATPYTRRQVARAVTAAGLEPGERVLDVGCGLGRSTLLLRKHGVEVEGLDLSPDLLTELGRRTGGSIPLHQADLAAPPGHLEGRFDAVTGFFVLHHVHDLVAALAGARRMLRPGGRVVWVEPNAFCPLFYIQVATAPTMSFRADGGIAQMRPGLLEHALRNAGFAEVRQETFGLVPPFVANRERGLRLERTMEDLPGLRLMRAFRLVVAR